MKFRHSLSNNRSLLQDSSRGPHKIRGNGKTVPTISTYFSNRSGLSIQEGLLDMSPQMFRSYKGDDRKASEDLRHQISGCGRNPNLSGAGVYSQKCVPHNCKEEKPPSSRVRSISLYETQKDTSPVTWKCDARMPSHVFYHPGNSQNKIRLIRQERLRKGRDLQDIESRISMLSRDTRPVRTKKTAGLQQQNDELKRRLISYSKAVGDFCEYISGPKCQEDGMMQVRETWSNVVQFTDESNDSFVLA